MRYLQQILLLPYATWWIPGGVFLTIVGGVYLFARRSPRLAGASLENDPFLDAGIAPLGTALKSKPREQRQSARRNGNPIAVFLAHPDHKHEPDRAVVVDRSMGGMRLVMGHHVEIGFVVSIRPVFAEDMVPWLDLEVRSCSPSAQSAGEFELGCQYVKIPPYSIMMLYG